MDNVARAAQAPIAGPDNSLTGNAPGAVGPSFRGRRISQPVGPLRFGDRGPRPAGQLGKSDASAIPSGRGSVTVRRLADRLEPAGSGYLLRPRSTSPVPIAIRFNSFPSSALPVRPSLPGPALQGESATPSDGAHPATLPGNAEPGEPIETRNRPWLSYQRNNACRELDKQLRNLLEGPDGSSQPHPNLRAAMRLVAQIERDAMQLGDLLEYSRTRMLCGSDWRTLSHLLSWYKDPARWVDAPSISGLAQREDLRSQFPALASEFRQRVADALAYPHSAGAQDAVRRVTVRLPMGPRHNALVESRAMPGTALRAHFAWGSPCNVAGVGGSGQAGQTLGLAATSLVNASDQLLYAGLRCSLHPWVAGHKAVPGDELELAAAALVADPRRFRRALDGEPVVLPLCLISLGFAPEITRWHASNTYRLPELQGLACQKRPAPLRLRETDGEGRDLSPRVWVREFDVNTIRQKVGGFSTLPGSFKPLRTTGEPGTDWRRDSGPGRHTAKSLDHLFFGIDEDISGDLGFVKKAMGLRLRQLDQQIVNLHGEYGRSIEQAGSENDCASSLLIRINQLHQEHTIIRKNALTLEKAEVQFLHFRAMWRKSMRDQPPEDIGVMIASRLALICHLIGEIPILNCRDPNLAMRVDTELKFLATVADHTEGQLLPVGVHDSLWRHARADFTRALTM